MSGKLKVAGVAAAAGLAIPVAGLSGLLALGSFLFLVLAAFGMGPGHVPHQSAYRLLGSGLMQFFLVSGLVFTVTFRFLIRLQKKAKTMVMDINAQEGLHLDGRDLLGYPSPVFLVFDRTHRKLAVCNSVSGDYSIHDFGWILAWQMTWREVESMEMQGSRAVNATGMAVPTFERAQRNKDFALELQVANPQQPILSFPMGQRSAETWCARLNALYNG